MLKNNRKNFILIFISIFLFGCNIALEHNDVDSVTPLEKLTEIEHFRDGALEHILEGEINRKGNAVGFHYNRLPTKKGEMIDGTETERNDFGIYEAEVMVDGVKKVSNKGKSTFFPDEWDTQEVIDAINEAYENKVFLSGNTYEGLTSEGIIIQMYLDQNGKIISAFPIYEAQ